MSRTPGNTVHRPAKGPYLYPTDEGKDLPVHKLSNFYLNFFDLIDVMAILIDHNGIIRMFNRKAGNMTGYSRGEAIGHDLFALLPLQERDLAREQVMGGLQQGIRHMELSIPVEAKGGGILPVCWSLSLVRDDDGKVFGMFGLGFVPACPDMPCLALGRQMEGYCSSVSTMTHDLLNQSQVVLGYLEMAMEQTGDNQKLHCMLGRATKSMVKCGDVAVKVHKLSNKQ
jgi:PAS domain S-box-containing protein